MCLHNNVFKEEYFNGLKVMVDKGPFYCDYLSRLYRVLGKYCSSRSRTLAVRVDLRFPSNLKEFDGREITRFFSSFKAKVDADCKRRFKSEVFERIKSVGYFWTKEYGVKQRPHYHLLILLDGDAYNTVGRCCSDNSNTFSRLEEAWASALNISMDKVSGLVEIPKDAAYRISSKKTEDENFSGFKEAFYRTSYLCKIATKNIGFGKRSMGSSVL